MYSDTTGLYFYSAWLQANAAIFAIVGIFAIYKLQTLTNKIDNMPTKLLMDGGQFVSKKDVKMFWIGNYHERDEILERLLSSKNHGDQIAFEQFYKWQMAIEQVRPTKQALRAPMVIMALGMMAHSIMLVLSSYIHNHYQTIETYFFIGASIFQGIVLFLVIYRIKDLVFARYDR